MVVLIIPFYWISYCLEVYLMQWCTFFLDGTSPSVYELNGNGFTLDAFSVSRSVRQGGVLSPILFTLYIDDLLKELSQSSVGCYWGNIFVGALAYADDLILLAPTPSALRKLLAICEKSGSVLRLTFNPDKTQCIRFSRERQGGHGTAFQFCSRYIGCVEYVDHLGRIISSE